MKIPCEYCGQMIPETAQTCPNCGAANSRVKRTAYGVPTTIEELREYCQRHNLPLQDMRVFLGEDYRGAKGTKSANLSDGIAKALKRTFIYQMVIFGLVMVILLAGWFAAGPSGGYYSYQDTTYYYDTSCWYEWDDYDEDWSPTQVDRELEKNADDYYQSRSWRAGYEVGDFTETSWYSEKEWASDDWDSGSDWDSSDSWDSSYDDWDSDW